MEDGVIINDSSAMNDIMTNWIVEHPNLITYLILEEALPYDNTNIPTQFLQKRAEKHKKIINTLKKSYDNHIFLLTPKQYNPSKQKTNLSPFLNGKYSYVRYKIESLKRKQFEEYSKNVAELLMFFGDGFLAKGDPADDKSRFIPDNVIFNFNINSFNKDSFKESKKIISLRYLARSYEELNIRISNNLNQLSKNKSDQKKLISRIIQGITKINDDVLSFFPLNPFDYEFEKFFFSPFFPFKPDFYNIVDNFQLISPTDVISNILELCYKIIRYFSLPESPADSILFLLIFRILYNELYSRKSLSFFRLKDENSPKDVNDATNSNINNNDRNNNNNLNNTNDNNNDNSRSNSNENNINNRNHSLFDFINSLTFASMGPPEDSSLRNDPQFTMDNNVFEIVSNDKRFSTAIISLTPIVFATNPLDALNSVRLCLLGVEKTASLCFEKKEIACMIPFDKVFTIFLFVVAGSGLEELFDCYAPFVQSCIPERLLSLPFQFALTKLSAAETHLRRLMYEQNSKKEKNNDKTPDKSKQ